MKETEMVINPAGSPLKTNIDTTTLSAYPQVTLISVDNRSDRPQEISIVRIYKTNLNVKDFLESAPVVIIMNIVTLYALFGDDIKTIAFPKSADPVFSSLVVVCLFFYMTELLLSFVFIPNYRWSFYFWLDLIAAISLIADIGWMWDSALNLASGNTSSESLNAAGEASRAGQTTSKVFRIIRLVRLVRLVKLYKNIQISLRKREKFEDEEGLFKDVEFRNESKVGKTMSETTMKRIIIIVLVLLFTIPIFDYDFYYSDKRSWDFGIDEISYFYNEANYYTSKPGFVNDLIYINSDPGYNVSRIKYWDYHAEDLRPIVFLRYLIKGSVHETKSNTTNYQNLRYNEIYYASQGEFIAIFDIRYDAKLSALLDIMRVIYICIILTLGSVYVSKDSEVLVIKPIEKMIEKVKLIAKNPIAAAEIQELYNKQEVQQKVPKNFCAWLCKSNLEVENYETKLLEDTILKIGVLLALGFGEAGSLIIGSNVEKGGEVDPMIEGNKVVGIYGFCDIRNFTDATEELQEGVMMFVNEIAQVVHGVVDKYLGAANKNIGDAFLLVWKFTDEEFFLDEDNNIIKNHRAARANYVPDLSLLSFLKILAKVNKDPEMLKYRHNQKLISRMPGYEIKMGFGLHLGWSIEGAIGSQFKIDASYLSPNVNVASALEGSTKIYGVPLLISETLFEVFSESVKKFCRQIDRVYIKGHSRPIGLFTSDCDFSGFSQGKHANRSKTFFRNKRKVLKKNLDQGKIISGSLFSDSSEIKLMRLGFSPEFFELFGNGVKQYLNGYWRDARKTLEEVLRVREKDGPSKAILSYMEEYGFVCPVNWENVRFL